MTDVVAGDEGWRRVAERINHEIRLRGWSLRSIESATGVNFRTLQKLALGQAVTRTDRLSIVANHFGWEGDAIDRLRAGQEPTPLEPKDEAPGLDERVKRLEDSMQEQRRQLQELRDHVIGGQS